MGSTAVLLTSYFKAMRHLRKLDQEQAQERAMQLELEMEGEA
jgi:hypothetical protein